MRQAEQPAIPKRWVMCPRIGDMVAHTQFVPLKTPLGRIYDPYLHPHHQFTPAMAVEQRNVTNIICLANTEKRYDATDREVNGKVISWDWIKCGQQAPTDERYREFEKTVKRILKENPSAVIGVHCTHGFNRTGFMIVRFLVETQKMDVIEALDLFKKARPPGIYKEDYVHRLLEVYKRSIDAYPFVKRKPNEIWMFPPAERTATYFQPVNQPDGRSEPVSDGTAEEEQVGRRCEGVIREEVRSVMRDMCKNMTVRRRVWFPGSQPVSLERTNLHVLMNRMSDYRATYKSDGVRYLLASIEGKNYVIDRKLEVRQVNVTLVGRDGRPLRNTLLDGELVKEVIDGKKSLNFLIFDIVIFEDFFLGENTWDTRMDYVSKGVIAFRQKWMEREPAWFQNEDFGVSPKPQWKLTDLDQLERYVQTNVHHETDGIIFTPLSMPYIYGQCPDILKWKPINMNSVDFIGMWHGGHLYLGVRLTHKQNDEYEDIPISILTGNYPDGYLASLDAQIIECAYDEASGAWFPMRKRTDKTTPNAYYPTFVGVWQSIEDNITVPGLLEDFRALEK